MDGKAPFVVEGQQVRGQYRYVIHRVQPIQRRGGVYDLDDIVVMPRSPCAPLNCRGARRPRSLPRVHDSADL